MTHAFHVVLCILQPLPETFKRESLLRDHGTETTVSPSVPKSLEYKALFVLLGLVLASQAISRFLEAGFLTDMCLARAAV